MSQAKLAECVVASPLASLGPKIFAPEEFLSVKYIALLFGCGQAFPQEAGALQEKLVLGPTLVAPLDGEERVGDDGLTGTQQS